MSSTNADDDQVPPSPATRYNRTPAASPIHGGASSPMLNIQKWAERAENDIRKATQKEVDNKHRRELIAKADEVAEMTCERVNKEWMHILLDAESRVHARLAGSDMSKQHLADVKEILAQCLHDESRKLRMKTAKQHHDEWIQQFDSRKVVLDDYSDVVEVSDWQQDRFQLHRDMALEIIRRVEPDSPLTSLFGLKKEPVLEYTAPLDRNVTLALEAPKRKRKGETSKEEAEDVSPPSDDDYLTACRIMRVFIVGDRKMVMRYIREHYAYKFSDASPLDYVRQCVVFFDKMFTHRVCDYCEVKPGNHLLKMGFSEDILDIASSELEELGPHDKPDLLEEDQRIWDEVKADSYS